MLCLAHFFWNFKQKDQGTAAALCMILATRKDIEKALLIILQPKRETMLKKQEVHLTRLQRHTAHTNRRSKTDQTGTPLTSTLNTDRNDVEKLSYRVYTNKTIRMFGITQQPGDMETHTIAQSQGDHGEATTGRNKTFASLSWTN